jgi:hypothetical protein
LYSLRSMFLSLFSITSSDRHSYTGGTNCKNMFCSSQIPQIADNQAPVDTECCCFLPPR